MLVVLPRLLRCRMQRVDVLSRQQRDCSVGHGSRSSDPYLTVGNSIVAGRESPAYRAAARVERVKVAIPASDVDRCSGSAGEA